MDRLYNLAVGIRFRANVYFIRPARALKLGKTVVSFYRLEYSIWPDSRRVHRVEKNVVHRVEKSRYGWCVRDDSPSR